MPLASKRALVCCVTHYWAQTQTMRGNTILMDRNILWKIALQVDYRDYARMRGVCRRWYRVLSEESNVLCLLKPNVADLFTSSEISCHPLMWLRYIGDNDDLTKLWEAPDDILAEIARCILGNLTQDFTWEIDRSNQEATISVDLFDDLETHSVIFNMEKWPPSSNGWVKIVTKNCSTIYPRYEAASWIACALLRRPPSPLPRRGLSLLYVMRREYWDPFKIGVKFYPITAVTFVICLWLFVIRL